MREMSLKVVIVFVCFNLFLSNSFAKSDENVVKTTSGSVRGLTLRVFNQSVQQFLGVPYAEPPVGNLRFAKPKPISKPIEGIIDATKAKYSCPQEPPSKLWQDFYGNLTSNEDCLTLNIWALKNNTKQKPVMFWIYGGGLSSGSIFQTIYNGSVLATQDVVLVAVNYRVGPFGFLTGEDESAPGNVGFYDQLLGLKWVRENIHLFGGDKNQITIFGESAGSWSVSAHLLSPLSKDLFKRAIMQSNAVFYNKDRPGITKEEAILSSKQTAKQLNCTDDKQWLQCLREVDAKKLIPFSTKFIFPVIGTEFLPIPTQEAFKQLKFNKDLDIMAGVTKDEGAILVFGVMPEVFSKNVTKDDFIKFFKLVGSNYFHNMDLNKTIEFYLNNTNINDSNAIKWKISDFLGDVGLKCPTYLFAKQYAEHSSPKTNVFFYELTHILKQQMPGLDLGVYHTADVSFNFGLPLLAPNTTSEENIRFTKYFVSLWTNFAKYGKPDNNWPKLIDTITHSSVSQIKDLNPKNPNKYFNDLFDKTCDGFWKKLRCATPQNIQDFNQGVYH